MFCLSKQELVTLASSVCGDYSQFVESGAIATPGMKPRARRFESGIFALGMYPVTYYLQCRAAFCRELVFQVKKEFLKASCLSHGAFCLRELFCRGKILT